MFGNQKDASNDGRRTNSCSATGIGWGNGKGDGITFDDEEGDEIAFDDEERVSNRFKASCIGNGNGTATGNWQNSHIGIVT